MNELLNKFSNSVSNYHAAMLDAAKNPVALDAAFTVMRSNWQDILIARALL
jgi:hypothetical protein